MKTEPKKILVVRNDKLGDFMLTWPAFATLKQALPNTEIHALVAPYTADMAALCLSIDEVVLDPGDKAPISAQIAFRKSVQTHNYDAAITLYSTSRIGLIFALAEIPYRLAPATKIAQIFYHKRLKQRRSRSEKPEWMYNQELALYYLSDNGFQTDVDIKPPYLEFDKASLREIKQRFCQTHQIDINAKLVFIHPGSGGSANNLNLEQYAQLGKSLTSNGDHHIVISAGPGEFEYAEQLGRLLKEAPHTVYRSSEGLEKFSMHIAIASLFISGSTGPLHIAGALNRPTAAFYPRRQSATALRWQTTNQEQRRLAFSPPEDAEAEDMTSIEPKVVAQQISQYFLAD